MLPLLQQQGDEAVWKKSVRFLVPLLEVPILLAPSAVTPLPAPHLGLSPAALTWGSALPEMDAPGLPGKAEEVVKASCFPHPFTMHLLFRWKYEPARLMLGIRWERKKTKGSSCLGWERLEPQL